MCVAQPGRVVAIEPEAAMVQIRNRTVRAATALVPDLAVGDEVLVTGGLIINRLPPGEAAARRELFNQLLSLVEGPLPPAQETVEERNDK